MSKAWALWRSQATSFRGLISPSYNKYVVSVCVERNDDVGVVVVVVASVDDRTGRRFLYLLEFSCFFLDSLGRSLARLGDRPHRSADSSWQPLVAPYRSHRRSFGRAVTLIMFEKRQWFSKDF